ncbi:probable protein phosphatase 2C 65 [Diospyros lotus]|uniref:probable protein phosphatase 2C 65 n=1 Tax=Diospyros lotus TaxID=55363 RepID=UPI002258C9D3|nr:probable protein phosphatase 2C 65 [Diospyros lotus]
MAIGLSSLEGLEASFNSFSWCQIVIYIHSFSFSTFFSVCSSKTFLLTSAIALNSPPFYTLQAINILSRVPRRTPSFPSDSRFIFRENCRVPGSVISSFLYWKMGGCCSVGARLEGFTEEETPYDEKQRGGREVDDRVRNGVKVRLEGSSRLVSMFSQQGKKGINQDAMTVWENFNGEKDAYFCAVFDGHGPLGHKVAQEVRHSLPRKLCSVYKQTQINKSSGKIDAKDDENNPFFSSWKTSLIQTYEEVDKGLDLDVALDAYCSGSTSVAVLKQGEHLVIANLGDSRAVLCRRNDKNQLVSEQLTVDLKPNLPNEAERIKNCEGRVFAMEGEPEVFRIWMPQENCPGLAMARAFGDFCLKDFGLISTPEVSYRKLTDKDEFLVLATDGVWDALSNNEVVKIVASAKKRSTAARLLVDRAVRAWRHKYPASKVDDCAVICLFLNNRPLLTKSMSEASRFSTSYSEFGAPKNLRTDDGLDTVINCETGAGQPGSSLKKLSRSVSQGISQRRIRPRGVSNR